MQLEITALKALEDNYIWMIEEGGQAFVVDPGESHVVEDYLKKNNVQLLGILLTHKHDDHTQGVHHLRNNYDNLEIYGPVETAELNSQSLQEGDQVKILSTTFDVIKTAGHTEEHISYVDQAHLFCGDALFSAGCGRVFTGDYDAQFESMKKFAALDDGIKVYAGHEYTVTNLKFSLTMEPDHLLLNSALEGAQAQIDQGQATLPSTIGFEKQINLFMQAETVDDFKKLRDQRDQF